jgi:hypothetical protein
MRNWNWLILASLLAVPCRSQESLPTPAPTLPQSVLVQSTESLTLGDSDQFTVKRALTGLGSYKQVGGILLIDTDAVPAVANVGYLKLSGKFSTASIMADDFSRNPIATEKVSDSEWLVKGSGRVLIVATVITENPLAIEQRRFDVVIPALKPDPKPEPDVEPKPDEPKPHPVTPSPFSGDGVRVLVVYELDDVSSYSPEQMKTLYSKRLRTWAIENCAKDASGAPEMRIFDQHTAGQPEQWQKLLAKPRQAMPWLIVGNGKKGYEGPLPATEAETIALLETFK